MDYEATQRTVNKIKETGALLAGEMSGHIFIKERWYGFDDALYAAARLLEILGKDERSSNEVFAALPDSVNTPELNVVMQEGEPPVFINKLMESAHFDGATISTIDGLRADYDDGWGLVRASNTTPVLVLRFEADNDDYSSIQDRAFTKVIKFMMFFEGSVRGLSVGAPVDFNGIKVGTVLDIRLEFDSENSDFRIPVLIEIEPERIKIRGNQETVSPYETVDKLVEKGLRASLQIGSLLTGQLFIGFSMRPDTPINLSGEETPYPELPTIRATDFGSIAQSAEIFLNKLNRVDIDTLSQELLKTLEGTNRLFNGPEIKGALDDLQTSLQAFRGILQKVDGSNLQETINSGHVVMEKITETMGTFDETLIQVNSLLKPNSPLQYNIIKLTGELEETARSIRSLVDTLERHPQALIFGKGVQVEEE